MSADNIVFLQRCVDGYWRAWEQSASVDPQRPADNAPTHFFVTVDADRTAAIVAAHDYQQTRNTEYGVYELDAEDVKPNVK
jgi:hypothetical protein